MKAVHPNRLEFRGVLARVDEPSDRVPSGARGHKVVLTREAAEAALPSLLGMGVSFSETLNRHDVRTKVGIITRAAVVGVSIEVEGYLFARDFPEVVALVERREPALGLSYEVTDVHLADPRATVWELKQLTFTGVGILRRDKAAYGSTSIALATA